MKRLRRSSAGNINNVSYVCSHLVELISDCNYRAALKRCDRFHIEFNYHSSNTCGGIFRFRMPLIPDGASFVTAAQIF